MFQCIYVFYFIFSQIWWSKFQVDVRWPQNALWSLIFNNINIIWTDPFWYFENLTLFTVLWSSLHYFVLCTFECANTFHLCIEEFTDYYMIRHFKMIQLTATIYVNQFLSNIYMYRWQSIVCVQLFLNIPKWTVFS